MKMNLKKNWKIPFVKENLKQKRKEKNAQEEHQALIDESQELDEIQLEIDHLFSEYDKKMK